MSVILAAVFYLQQNLQKMILNLIENKELAKNLKGLKGKQKFEK